MNRKSYTLDQITAILNNLPESALRRFAGIHIENPTTNNPRFTLVTKDEVASLVVEMKPGTVSFDSFGYSKVGNIARLSVVGDIGKDLVRNLFEAISWPRLAVDTVTQHSSYGFFPANERLDRTHYLMNLDTGYVSEIPRIDGTPATKIEFIGLENGSIELAALVNTKAVRTTLKLNELKSGYGFKWNPIKTDAKEVHDLSMRLVDGKPSIVLATTDGIQMYRDNEIISFKSTKDLDVTVLDAGFAGVLDPFDTLNVKKNDVVGDVIGFVTEDGRLMTIPTNPTNKMIPTLVTDKIDTKATKIISDGIGWYARYGNTIRPITATPVSA